MIKWEIIKIDMYFDIMDSNTYQENLHIRKEKPCLYIWKCGSKEYSIPIPKHIDPDGYGWCFHNDSVPSLYYYSTEDNYTCWYWYNTYTEEESEWKDPNWRKRAEIKLFL